MAREEGGTVPTFQLGQGDIPEAGLAEGRRRLLAVPPAGRVLAARQRVPHVGVGDEHGQAGVGERDKDGLQGPAGRAQPVPTPLPAPDLKHLSEATWQGRSRTEAKSRWFRVSLKHFAPSQLFVP